MKAVSIKLVALYCIAKLLLFVGSDDARTHRLPPGCNCSSPNIGNLRKRYTVLPYNSLSFQNCPQRSSINCIKVQAQQSRRSSHADHKAFWQSIHQNASCSLLHHPPHELEVPKANSLVTAQFKNSEAAVSQAGTTFPQASNSPLQKNCRIYRAG